MPVEGVEGVGLFEQAVESISAVSSRMIDVVFFMCSLSFLLPAELCFCRKVSFDIYVSQLSLFACTVIEKFSTLPSCVVDSPSNTYTGSITLIPTSIASAQ